jgi:hypothetical protein
MIDKPLLPVIDSVSDFPDANEIFKEVHRSILERRSRPRPSGAARRQQDVPEEEESEVFDETDPDGLELLESGLRRKSDLVSKPKPIKVPEVTRQVDHYLLLKKAKPTNLHRPDSQTAKAESPTYMGDILDSYHNSLTPESAVFNDLPKQSPQSEVWERTPPSSPPHRPRAPNLTSQAKPTPGSRPLPLPPPHAPRFKSLDLYPSPPPPRPQPLIGISNNDNRDSSLVEIDKGDKRKQDNYNPYGSNPNYIHGNWTTSSSSEDVKGGLQKAPSPPQKQQQRSLLEMEEEESLASLPPPIPPRPNTLEHRSTEPIVGNRSLARDSYVHGVTNDFAGKRENPEYEQTNTSTSANVRINTNTNTSTSTSTSANENSSGQAVHDSNNLARPILVSCSHIQHLLQIFSFFKRPRCNLNLSHKILRRFLLHMYLHRVLFWTV